MVSTPPDSVYEAFGPQAPETGLDAALALGRTLSVRQSANKSDMSFFIYEFLLICVNFNVSQSVKHIFV
jgi:hypothetical protein